jgi:hypothetical protein
MSYENAPSPRVGASLLSDGKRLLVWGGASCGNLSETLNDGAWFDPEKNTWEPFTMPNQESVVSRIFHASFFFNNSIIFWGGFTNQKKARFLNDGWIYSRGDLISISKDKAPRPRHRSAVASSSEYLMVYGGEESERGEFVKQGGIYSYKDSKWKDISVHQAPEWTWKEEASSFWVGTLFTILHPKGISFYDPYDDSWTFQRLMSPKYPQYSEYSKFLWNGFEGIYWDPIEYNPAIQIYRGKAAEVRTVDEHPLRIRDLNLIKSKFSKVTTRFFWLSALIVFFKFYFGQNRYSVSSKILQRL